MRSVQGTCNRINKKACHLTEDASRSIPGGLTSQLQPLDVSVNNPFKGFMREEWTKWTEAPTHHVTPTGRVKRPSISIVCKWVRNTWQRVKSETIVKSLKNVALAMH